MGRYPAYDLGVEEGRHVWRIFRPESITDLQVNHPPGLPHADSRAGSLLRGLSSLPASSPTTSMLQQGEAGQKEYNRGRYENEVIFRAEYIGVAHTMRTLKECWYQKNVDSRTMLVPEKGAVIAS
jgi:hypothetical protein